jgi:hypothetical protein
MGKKAKRSNKVVRVGSRWTKNGVYIYAYVPKGLLQEENYRGVPASTLVDIEEEWLSEVEDYMCRRARKLAKVKGK